MKTCVKGFFGVVLPAALILGVAGCSKNETASSNQPAHSQTATPAKPKATELTKDVLLDAFKRASINNLPVFLKISDVQFDVINSVDTKRVIKGTVTLEFLEDTFKKTRALQFRTPSTAYQIQLLNIIKKKGEQISLPFSAQINLADDRPSVPLPALDDYGMEAARLPHCYVEGGDIAVKAEGLIQAAEDASHKSKLVDAKWESLKVIKDGLADVSTFDEFLNHNRYRNAYECIDAAFDDKEFTKSWGQRIFYNEKFNSLNDKLAAHSQMVQPRLDAAYPPVEKIVNDAKKNSQACSDYLLTL